MTTWTTPRTWTDGPVTTTEMNELRDQLQNLDERLTVLGQTSPDTVQTLNTAYLGCSFYMTGQATAGGGSDVALVFGDADEEWSKGSGLHGSSSSRFYATVTGLWRAELWVGFSANATGNREIAIQRSTGFEWNRVRDVSSLASEEKPMAMCADMVMIAGQYVEGIVNQDSGSNGTVRARFQWRLVAR